MLRIRSPINRADGPISPCRNNMKDLIVFTILASIVLTAIGCGSATAKAVKVKPTVSNSQFRGSDHMPPEALAAKRAAGY